MITISKGKAKFTGEKGQDVKASIALNKEISSILNKCKAYKGNSLTEISDDLEELYLKFGAEELKQKFI